MKRAADYCIGLAQMSELTSLAAIECAAATLFPAGSIPDEILSDSVPLDILEEACKNETLWVAKNKLDPVCWRFYR